MDLPTLRCNSCHYEWIPRVPNPKVCPNKACHSPAWSSPHRGVRQVIADEMEEHLYAETA